MEAFEADINNPDLVKNPKSNATERAQQYDSVLNTLIDFHAPLATKKISPKPPNPWMTPAILASKRHRRYLERVWRRYPIALNRSRFSKQIHPCNKQMSKAKSAYYSKIIAEHSGDHRSLWQAFNKILHCCPKMYIPDHSSITALANTFSSFFINKISIIRFSFPSGSCSNVLTPPNTRDVQHNLSYVTDAEVRRLVLSAPCKSSDLDPLPTGLVKDCIDVLVTPIMLEELNNEGKKDGMKLNKKKTKIMCNEVARRRPRTGVKIDAEQLEEVTEYKYLGRLITSGNELSKEIGERITSGWRRFGDYSHFLRDKKIPTCLKRKIMDTVILPAMTYGAETWTLTKHLERKLAVAQRSMERSLLNITRRDKIRNEIIRSKTGVIDIIEKVKCMKGQWAGHVARMKNTRWAKITSEWTPRDGKRLRGRPKRRWRDDIEEAVGSQWMRTAQDRSAWRKLWRPSASSGMNG